MLKELKINFTWPSDLVKRKRISNFLHFNRHHEEILNQDLDLKFKPFSNFDDNINSNFGHRKAVIMKQSLGYIVKNDNSIFSDQFNENYSDVKFIYLKDQEYYKCIITYG